MERRHDVRLNKMDDLVLILPWLFLGVMSSLDFFILWLYLIRGSLSTRSISGCCVWTC